ncbi:MAG: hypothetical protein IKL22_04295 [Lachnospiraceae bacterium]|nr:hypothetical protein [Lachnospiraceae bacterium]
MDSKDKTIDNSLESAMNMTQDEIEWLLNQQSGGTDDSLPEDLDADLMSLLADLESSNDENIQDISALLTKDERNEAVDDSIAALLNAQEEPGETAYDAMDLFSGEEPKKEKKGLLSKFSRKKKEKKEKKEKTAKKPKKKDKKTESREPLDWESIELPEDYTTNMNDNSLDDALTMLQGTSVEEKKKEEPVKKETAQKEKKKKDKKKKEKTNDKSKKKTEKNGGKDTKEKIKIKEKATIEEAIMELEAESEEAPNKKKITMVFLASILILCGFLVVNYYFTGHANKRLAREAFEEKDYLECYQLLYGQRLNDSQSAMYHRSELILKDSIFWRDYDAYVKQEQWLEGLDELVQYVYNYPELEQYADKWNCSDIVVNTHEQVQEILVTDYNTDVERASQIAKLKKDEDYTRALLKLVEEKQKRDAIYKKYPDILPEEEERLFQ